VQLSDKPNDASNCNSKNDTSSNKQTNKSLDTTTNEQKGNCETKTNRVEQSQYEVKNIYLSQRRTRYTNTACHFTKTRACVSPRYGQLEIGKRLSQEGKFQIGKQTCWFEAGIWKMNN
jgi:hypothetical protein